MERAEKRNEIARSREACHSAARLLREESAVCMQHICRQQTADFSIAALHEMAKTNQGA